MPMSIVLLFPRFSISRICSDCFFFIVSVSNFRSWTVFISFSCLITFSCISLRDLFSSFKASYFYNLRLKIVFLHFMCDSISKACCGRITGFQWYHVALDFVACVLQLTSSHLVVSGISRPSGP